MKTFQYSMKRFQFIQNTEKGTLFSFSTCVEKWFLAFTANTSCDCIYVKKHRRKIK